MKPEDEKSFSKLFEGLKPEDIQAQQAANIDQSCMELRSPFAKMNVAHYRGLRAQGLGVWEATVYSAIYFAVNSYLHGQGSNKRADEGLNSD